MQLPGRRILETAFHGALLCKLANQAFSDETSEEHYLDFLNTNPDRDVVLDVLGEQRRDT